MLQVTLSEEVRPAVALTHKECWPKEEKSRANVNILNPGKETDLGESTSVLGVEVSIIPVLVDAANAKQGITISWATGEAASSRAAAQVRHLLGPLTAKEIEKAVDLLRVEQHLGEASAF